MSKWVDLDQGWQPCRLAFCGSKKAWREGAKKYGFESEAFPELNSAAVCTLMTKGQEAIIIISMLKPSPKISNVQVIGALAHECLHALDYMLEQMGESGHGAKEWRAYALQQLVQMTLTAYADCHGRQSE